MGDVGQKSRTAIAGLRKSLSSSAERDRWLRVISKLSERLTIPTEVMNEAVAAYDSIAAVLKEQLHRDEIYVYPQGSVRYRTTTAPYGREMFDVDVVCEVRGWEGSAVSLFERIGDALDYVDGDAGNKDPKKRCWRLPYPGKKFYLDITPARPLTSLKEGPVDVTDMAIENWSPSHPNGYAEWFNRIADQVRFRLEKSARLVEARARADVKPVDLAPVEVTDILRISVQLMKHHRNRYFWNRQPEDKDQAPISIIITTLAAQAYQDLATHREYEDPMELLLDVVERMVEVPRDIYGNFYVANPTNQMENFAERWNEPGSRRHVLYEEWIASFATVLEALSRHSEADGSIVKDGLGDLGYEAWSAWQPSGMTILSRLAKSAPTAAAAVPAGPQTLA